MPQIRLFAETTETVANRLFAALDARFLEDGPALATMETDAASGRWEMSAYLDAEEEQAVAAAFAEAIAAIAPGLALQREALAEIDWVARSLEGLKPVRAGRFVVHGSHDRSARRPGAIAIEIDAGQAFGTGHHGTTAGCLEMIEAVMRARPVRRALDLGTGSGVLAIAMARRAPVAVLATDIDPVAIAVARANMRQNGIVGRHGRNGSGAAVRAAVAAGLDDPLFARTGPFDLIVANILARPLMAMAPQIARHRAPGGSVILSGILAEQRWKVLAAFALQGLHHERTLWRGGWVTMLLR